MTPETRDLLAHLLDDLNEFNRECNDAEHTDVGIATYLLEQSRSLLTRIKQEETQ